MAEATISELQERIHQTAKEHGWWEKQTQSVLLTDQMGNAYLTNAKVERSMGDLLALVHSEVSEALEAYRIRGREEWIEMPEPPRTLVGEMGYAEAAAEFAKLESEGKPEGVFTELGDAIIRILDLAGYYGVDMGEVIERKMAYNDTRSYRHGGKKL